MIEKFSEINGFDWDRNNFEKNWIKHGVLFSECEEVFPNVPLLVSDDENHSLKEKRYYALGRTNQVRLLFIVFTFRNDKIRIISARDMSKKERGIYYNAT